MNEAQARRLAGMPRSYRATYKQAITGKSLRAAVNAQCLECCGWQREEVKLCTDYGCPLHTVRPYRFSQNARDGRFNSVESLNGGRNA